MVCKFISDWMCKHGNHDFKVAASWTSTDKSLVILEDVCTRCGEDAYSIITFKPSKCTTLVRSTDKLDELLAHSAAEDSHCGRRADDWLEENNQKYKSAKRTQAKEEKAAKN